MSGFVTIGDICDILNGYAFKSNKYVDAGIRVIRITNVQKGFIEDADPQYYPVSEQKEIEKYMLQEGDLLMSLTGNVGRVALLGADMLPAALNQRVACLRIKESAIIYKPFLFHLLNSDYFESKCILSSKGVAQKNMSTEWLKDYSIPLFPMEQQIEIASIFDKINAIIASRKEQVQNLDQLVKSRFIELFRDKYQTMTLENVCEELFAGGDVKKDRLSDIKTDEYPYPIYTNGEKNNGLYGYTNIIRVKKEAVTISGRGTIGFTCLRKEAFYPAVRLIVAVPNQQFVSGCYLKYFIESKNYGGQGASIPQLTVPMIKDELIPVPPIELQEQFAAFVEQVDKSKLAIQKSLENLETLKKALMQKYFG